MEKELIKIILPIGQDSKKLIRALQKANIKNFIFLRTLYEGPLDNYRFYNGQLIIRIENKLLQVFDDGKTKVLYEGPLDDYQLDNGQLIVIIDDKFFEVLKDGNTKLIYQGPWDDFDFDFDNGQLIIRIGDSFYAIDFLCIEPTK